VSLRWSFRRLRRRLRRFRLLLAILAGAVGVALGMIYDSVPPSLQIAALLVMGIFGAASVLLTEPPEATDHRKSRHSTADEPRVAIRTARNTTRAPLASPWRWLGWRRREVVPALPPRDDFFQGREQELAYLREMHDRQRQDRAVGMRSRRWLRRSHAARRKATGPVVLLVHGKPGVGKTAIADELAWHLAPQYPHGQVYVNLGTGGAARTPKEILKDFLLALGWDEDERMPETTVGRATIFRSLTAKKKILFILDAARHADQVRHVLPGDPAAAVIITSRRDLTWSDLMPEPSYLLGLPKDDEALSIFRAVSGTEESTHPECAAEIVRLCGRLPLAIRAAAERVSVEDADICLVAELLRKPRSRLSWLDRPGRPLRAHLQTEYDRLLPREQRALAMIVLIPSSTFVPWALAPMMELPPAQVEVLVDRLAGAQLLDDLGMDEASEVARYGLHPLIRLFAVEQAARLTEEERRQAQARLTEAYHEVVSAVLHLLHPDFRPSRPRRWLPADSKLPQRIANRREPWVRAEYPNLLRMLAPEERDDSVTGRSLRWRVGAWLGGCVAEGVSSVVTLRAFAEATSAAEQDRNDLGLVDVLLAKGTFLVAIERYREAEKCLRRAAGLSDRLRIAGDGSATREAARRTAIATRKIGEAYLQAASYQQGLDALEDAAAQAEAIGDESEQRLIRILLAEAHHVDTPEVAHKQLFDPALTDATRYRVLLSLAEAGRRRREWRSAAEYLGRALRFVDGDLRRMATVQYRMARLLLDQHAEPAGTDRDTSDCLGPAARAARRAAAAAVTFRQMGNELGVVRAHCLLARAVLAMGHPIDAEQLVRTADGELAVLQASGEKPQVLAPLTARLQRVKGEIHLHNGDWQRGRQFLLETAAAYNEQRNRGGLRAVQHLLDRADPVSAGLLAADRPAPTVAEGRSGRVDGPMVGGPFTLSTSASEDLAVRLSGQIFDRMQDEIRQAFSPPTPVAFRGAIAAWLTGATQVNGEQGPIWRVPLGQTCDLTVLVVTGEHATADVDHQRSGLAGPMVDREVAVTTGTKADQVELTLMVDAPFIYVSDPELQVSCQVDGDVVRHHSLVRLSKPGEWDLRITLLSSGRLVQSLPIQLQGGDDEETGEKRADPVPRRDGVHQGQ
jgi:tetratricopeptide (TPR) repeat protein